MHPLDVLETFRYIRAHLAAPLLPVTLLAKEGKGEDGISYSGLGEERPTARSMCWWGPGASGPAWWRCRRR